MLVTCKKSCIVFWWAKTKTRRRTKTVEYVSIRIPSNIYSDIINVCNDNDFYYNAITHTPLPHLWTQKQKRGKQRQSNWFLSNINHNSISSFNRSSSSSLGAMCYMIHPLMIKSHFFDLRRKVYYTLIIDSRFIDQMLENFSPNELQGSKWIVFDAFRFSDSG